MTTLTDFGAYCAPMPASAGHLVDLEQQLAGLLVQFDFLSEAWPMAPRAVDRASIGREHSQAAGACNAASPWRAPRRWPMQRSSSVA